MTRDGTLPATPGELDAWIAADPQVRDALERGGFGSHFDSADLLPLLQVFAGAGSGGTATTAGSDVPPRRTRWLLPLLALAALLLLLFLFLSGALSF